ncbi:MAG: phage major capsid protein [Oscillospiraceae bacterium]|nr:phage major capsid protein [Oscillospiraceae bacterium]
MKELIEKRGSILGRMRELLDGIKNEKRAFSEEEQKEYAQAEKELAAIDVTLKAEKRAQAAMMAESEEGAEEDTEGEKRASAEVVSDFIRGAELRADEMTVSGTGSIVPSDFSQDIIHDTFALSGVLNMVSVVNSKGTYKQIVSDKANMISAGWTDEIAEITASDAKFTTIEIGHHKLTALSKLSLELINQNQFDIAAEVMRQTERDFAIKAETAIISGDGAGKPFGLVTSGTPYALASASAITADEIVKVYHALKSPFHQNAVWIMSNDTLCAVRLLTDGSGRYIFHQNENLTSGYAGYILGKPVVVSDAMENLGSSAKPILFGDFGRAYKVNINPDVSMQILNEKYADFGMKGVLSIMWLDGKPVNPEAYVTVSCPA